MTLPPHTPSPATAFLKVLHNIHQMQIYRGSQQSYKTSLNCRGGDTTIVLVTFCMSHAKCTVVTHVCQCVCVSVCLSAAVCPHYCTDPDVTWGVVGDTPLVVHYWADLQSVHGLRCYGNITRTLVTSLHPSRDMTT